VKPKRTNERTTAINGPDVLWFADVTSVPSKSYRKAAAFLAVVAIDKVEVALAAPGVIVAGEKVHVASLGKPEQAKETVWLKPPTEFAVNRIVPV
jgi:hypothetical protein